MKACWMVAALAVAACSRYTGPAAPTPREATQVQAPAVVTWDAAIATFAEVGIPIRAIERGSGLIVSDDVRLGVEGRGLADCGTLNSQPLYPNFASYNALVRGDSASSNVKLTVVWSHVGDKAEVKDCSTSHQFERGFEESVKSRAEDSSTGLAERKAPAPRRKPATPARRPRGTDHSMVPDTANLDYQNARAAQQLLSNPNFSQVIGDLYRKGLIIEFREVAVERLEVELSALAFSTPALDYQLTRLFLAYGTTLTDATNPIVLLMANGEVTGWYSRGGLQWSTAP